MHRATRKISGRWPLAADYSRRQRRRRGTAELELAMAIPVLIAIIFLAAAGLRLGLARLDLEFAVQQAALFDATVAGAPQYAPNSDLTPPDGIEAIRPELPNRMHVAELTVTSDYTTGFLKLKPVTLKEKVAVLGATWAYSAYPDPDDRQVLQDWFTQYVDESHADIATPLGLQPAWTP